MKNKTKITIGVLVLILLATSTYVLWPEQNLKMRVDRDKTTFYVINENNRWIVSGREYFKLFDGVKRLNRRLSETYIKTTYDDESTTITRHTKYIRGAEIIDTYYFRGDIEEKEQFPISHKIEIFNATGKLYQYEIRDVIYDGETKRIDDLTEFEFGRNMKVTWDNSHYYAKVFKTGILKVKYRMDSDYVVIYNRLFDPEDSEEDWEVDDTGISSDVTTWQGAEIIYLENTSKMYLFGKNDTTGYIYEKDPSATSWTLLYNDTSANTYYSYQAANIWSGIYFGRYEDDVWYINSTGDLVKQLSSSNLKTYGSNAGFCIVDEDTSDEGTSLLSVGPEVSSDWIEYQSKDLSSSGEGGGAGDVFNSQCVYDEDDATTYAITTIGTAYYWDTGNNMAYVDDISGTSHTWTGTYHNNTAWFGNMGELWRINTTSDMEEVITICPMGEEEIALEDDFESGNATINATNFPSSGTVVQSDMCGVYDGTYSLTFNSTDRNITTKGLDIKEGYISFYLRFADGTYCNEPDAGEDLKISYSIDDGDTWTQIVLIDESNTSYDGTWGLVNISIPSGAKSRNAKFMFAQTGNPYQDYDQFMIDDLNFEINPNGQVTALESFNGFLYAGCDEGKIYKYNTTSDESNISYNDSSFGDVWALGSFNDTYLWAAGSDESQYVISLCPTCDPDINVSFNSGTDSLLFNNPNVCHRDYNRTVAPENQTDANSVINGTNNGTGSADFQMKVNETIGNYTLIAGDGSSNTTINTSWQTIITGVSEDESVGIWLWINCTSPTEKWYPLFQWQAI